MQERSQKAALLASLGAGLEYYDFIIYGLMATFLSQLFFSEDVPWIAILKTFSVFAIGYITRPLGGILFGAVGDVYGRKKTFMTVMLLMAGATFSIGLLPTYQQIGPLAPLLLLGLRLVQGLSFGAELPGAITFVCEYTEDKKRGLHSGFVISSVGFGSTLATFMLYLLTTYLEPRQVLAWGWRLPFVLGGFLAIVNYFIRRYLEETPEFQHLEASRKPPALNQPFLDLLKFYKKRVAIGIGITWFLASLVIINLFFPTYLTTSFDFVQQDVYFAMTIGLLWSSSILPFCGIAVDRIGRRRMMLITSLVYAFGGGYLVFQLLNLKSFYLLIGFMILHQTFIAVLSVCYFPLLSNLFHTSVRYTGIASCYNIAYTLMSASPMLLTWMINTTQSAYAGLWFMCACAVVTTVSVLVLINAKLESKGVLKI